MRPWKRLAMRRANAPTSECARLAFVQRNGPCWKHGPTSRLNGRYTRTVRHGLPQYSPSQSDRRCCMKTRCSPNLNAYAERWVRSVKDECLSKLILVGEPALRTALRAYVEHFHGERNHQGKGNLLLFPCEEMDQNGPVRCRERLGGLLKFYYRPAA